ncbi:MAG: hypothetical protein HZB72_05070 [Burkholderiales bacterium]|nr:hypothetical protein [Burkholderiales bacterium]
MKHHPAAPPNRLGSVAALTLLVATGHAAAQSHFTAVRAQIDRGEPPILEVIESRIDASFAEVGTMPELYAKARASFGNNGALATATHQPLDLGAYAESIWMDGFTIAGDGGQGVLDISVQLTGTLDGGGQPGGPGSNSSYRLFVSSSPMTCDFDEMSCTGTLLIAPIEDFSGTHVATARLPFTYGQTFYLASYLGAEVLGHGQADFFGSAHFGATAPGGGPLVGSSGVTYALASAVPEPAPLGALLAGLMVIGLAGRRMHRFNNASGAPAPEGQPRMDA